MATPYTATVIKGTGHASILGYPTANLDSDVALVTQADGIYAATVTIDGTQYHGAAYLDHDRPVFEVHLLTEEKLDLYGAQLSIHLHKKVSDKKPFEDEDALRSKITEDIVLVKRYFSEME